MRKHPRKFDRNSELVGRRRHLSGIEDGDGGASTRKNGVMSSPGDAMLARGAQAGDAISLGILFERHRARLHAVALGMLGHGPDAEDAVQDAIVIAILRIGDCASRPQRAAGWSPSWSTSAARGCAAAPRSRWARTPPICVARSTACRRSSNAARCATGCGQRWSDCPSPSAWRSCCATSQRPIPTTPSPTSATFRSAPCAAASTPPANSSPISCSPPPPRRTPTRQTARLDTRGRCGDAGLPAQREPGVTGIGVLT